MLILTSIFTRSILVAATVGSLSVLADGAVRSQLERAVRGNLVFLGHSPVSAQVARPVDRYLANGLDRNRLTATIRMVGAADAP